MAAPSIPSEPDPSEVSARTATVSYTPDATWQDCVGCITSGGTESNVFFSIQDEGGSDLQYGQGDTFGLPASFLPSDDALPSQDAYFDVSPADGGHPVYCYISFSNITVSEVSNGACGEDCETAQPCQYEVKLNFNVSTMTRDPVGQSHVSFDMVGPSGAITIDTSTPSIDLVVVSDETDELGSLQDPPEDPGYLRSVRYEFTTTLDVNCGSDAGFEIDCSQITAQETSLSTPIPCNTTRSEPLFVVETLPKRVISVSATCSACRPSADTIIGEVSSDGGATYTQVASGPSALGALALPGLTPGTSYLLRLYVTGADGNSGYATSSFTTLMINQDLWQAVVDSYDSDGLITLTNIRDRSATTINTAVGESAAQGVIDLWTIYAQAEYDDTVPSNVEVAKRAVIAMLWQRGGSASSIAKVEWDEVFGDQGLLGRLRKSASRGHGAPRSSSGAKASSELTSDGRRVRPWSDPDSLPVNFLPNRRSADDA